MCEVSAEVQKECKAGPQDFTHKLGTRPCFQNVYLRFWTSSWSKSAPTLLCKCNKCSSASSSPLHSGQCQSQNKQPNQWCWWWRCSGWRLQLEGRSRGRRENIEVDLLYISVFRLRSWTGSKRRRRFLDQMVSWLLVWGGRKSGQKTKKFKLKNVMKLSTFGKPLDILYHFLVVSFCYCRWDIFATFLSINSYQCGNCQLSLSNFLRSRIFFLILSQNNQTAGHKMLIKVNCLAKKLKS